MGCSRKDGGGGGGAYLIMRAGAAGVRPRYESEPPGLGFACALETEVVDGGGRWWGV